MSILSIIMILPIVEDFIKENIQSVWQLELLLYIRARGNSLRTYELAAALYTSPDAVGQALQHFEQRGLLCRAKYNSSEYFYSPVSNQLRESVDQTAKAFSERKVAIIQYIFSHQNSASLSHGAVQSLLDLKPPLDYAEDPGF